MTHFAESFSPSVMRPLGWALVHFVWEGAALAALLSVAMAMCRSARTRYALAVGTLVLMVGAPVATFFVARNAGATVPARAAATAQQILPAQKAAAPQPALLSTLTTQKVSPDLLLLLVEVWMAGVLFLSLRNLGGLVLVERLRRKESKPVG